MKRLTLVTEHMNQPVYYGGFILRRGDVIRHLDEVAKTWDKKNWFRLREAGLLGNYQYNEMHGYPPTHTIPISLVEFKRIIGEA